MTACTCPALRCFKSNNQAGDPEFRMPLNDGQQRGQHRESTCIPCGLGASSVPGQLLRTANFLGETLP